MNRQALIVGIDTETLKDCQRALLEDTKPALDKLADLYMNAFPQIVVRGDDVQTIYSPWFMRAEASIKAEIDQIVKDTLKLYGFDKEALG